ncbi:MAG: acyltransferase [Candidatus Amulumruptor caecigallinarius]|nr:acyltransferase [Candidatus Amulumruptor caecigallinarius]MCM1396286.1 acyltransferase [Candidatus Amulumruptor caecigallinarius]MCM1454280.1 acyltransferase [bacterium]
MTPTPALHKRARYLDITKGLAIICIVLLHFGTGLIPGLINVYIGTFMITTFYVTAGWVDSMKPRQPSFRARIKRLWHQLGVPYVVWTIIILAFDVMFWAIGHYDSYIIMRDIFKSLCLRGIGTLWFLPALFGGQILWWWIRGSRRWWVVGLSLVLLYYVIIVDAKLINHITSGMDAEARHMMHTANSLIGSVINAYVGLVCGFAYGRMSSMWKLPNRSRWLLIVLGLLGLWLGWFFTFLLPFNAGFLWNWLAPNVIPAGFIVLFMTLETSPVLRLLDYWGRNSMALMVTHYSILIVIANIIALRITGHIATGSGWLSFATFCVIMAVEYFVAEWLRHRFPLSLGIVTKHSKSTITETNDAKHS